MELSPRFNPTWWSHAGIALYAAAVTGLGVQVFVCQKPVPGLEPLPAWLPGHLLLANFSGFMLFVLGVHLMIKTRRNNAALVLGALFSLWFLLLQVPPLVSKPNGSRWTAAFETLAIAGAAWAAGHLRNKLDTISSEKSGFSLARFGGLCYGISLPVFGVLHICYAAFVATLVPTWIPGHLFWTYFVAAAFLAGGAGIVSGVLARPAAIWTGIMFLSWVLIVHAPRVVLYPMNPAEWTSLLVALAMGGGAWIVAGTISSRTGSIFSATGRA